MRNASLLSDPGLLDDARPPRLFGLPEGAELFGAAAAGIEAIRCELLANIRAVQRLEDLGVEAVDDLAAGVLAAAVRRTS